MPAASIAELRLLDATRLACVRGERTLFTDVSFTLAPGTLLRVAGPNGSGKTSLLRIVCGLMAPDEGAVRWNGEDIRRLREEYWRELTYVGHSNALKDELTAVENLEIGAALGGRDIGRDAAWAALTDLGVASCADLPARVLSQGQRRRVALARLALSASAPLWVLDEPFTALDSAAVASVQALVAEHLARGGEVVLTTHHDVPIDVARSARIDLSPETP